MDEDKFNIRRRRFRCGNICLEVSIVNGSIFFDQEKKPTDNRKRTVYIPFAPTLFIDEVIILTPQD